MKTNYSKYKQAIIKSYIDKGLSRADAEKRASITLRIAAILEERLRPVKP